MKFYKHVRFMDVLADLKVVYRDSNRVKVKIQWWNKGQTGTPFPIGVTTNHEIPADVFVRDWSVVIYV